MKRNELSLHRKEQMAASLKKLMTRKNLGRITIQELADDCGINRYTFYYHFQDIYDLLAWAASGRISRSCLPTGPGAPPWRRGSRI